jgi:hypothetical protein
MNVGFNRDVRDVQAADDGKRVCRLLVAHAAFGMDSRGSSMLRDCFAVLDGCSQGEGGRNSRREWEGGRTRRSVRK